MLALVIILAFYPTGAGPFLLHNRSRTMEREHGTLGRNNDERASNVPYRLLRAGLRLPPHHDQGCNDTARCCLRLSDPVLLRSVQQENDVSGQGMRGNRMMSKKLSMKCCDQGPEIVKGQLREVL
jgi:hypothetical protein